MHHFVGGISSEISDLEAKGISEMRSDVQFFNFSVKIHYFFKKMKKQKKPKCGSLVYVKSEDPVFEGSQYSHLKTRSFLV
jgi:hypothetical protein